ncbi:unnamed protein product [Rotaria magnacalcarata]|uniref:TIR domain-containing protein n=1 Tax=Rotaria magnacalcarata TaxID=392030 RepID=A0A815P3T5_9BILA|nr:unnamed protein product [Rotaria magnacalcarata]CAF1606365.1 unnamed protein product [Rotaria magnacalcarata]CAF2126083.1 unnamed protein product [Rotaria magnacalcarata]CAF3892143.1 unnamed protein product [Rotaria magnacalcarata]CAF3907394.1 unnamed protein product [Rotaria magnacalcarata]
MDQVTLIEDIISTKNTLKILHQVYTVNQRSLQPFSLIFDSITELIDILTHSSTKQIEIALLSTDSNVDFNKLQEKLNELSDAITTKNSSIINTLNGQLNSFVQKLRLCSSYAVNGEETADDIFKKTLSQSRIDAKTRRQSDSFEGFSKIPTSQSEHVVEQNVSVQPSSVAKQMDSFTNDPFAAFRFARLPRLSISSQEIENTSEAGAPPPAHSPFFKEMDVSIITKSSQERPRLMISYNHDSKPLCINIYNSLTKDGYEVWIDLKEMHGNTLVAMAKAIENADIILFCVTEKYSQSHNCQKEAEYAFVQQKIMIPLLLQANYKPTGWLGFLMGASLYINFIKGDFAQNYSKLKSEIEANALCITSNKNDVPILTLDSTANSTEQTQKETDNSRLQLTKAKSESIVRKSRSCILF